MGWGAGRIKPCPPMLPAAGPASCSRCSGEQGVQASPGVHLAPASTLPASTPRPCPPTSTPPTFTPPASILRPHPPARRGEPQVVRSSWRAPKPRLRRGRRGRLPTDHGLTPPELCPGAPRWPCPLAPRGRIYVAGSSGPLGFMAPQDLWGRPPGRKDPAAPCGQGWGSAPNPPAPALFKNAASQRLKDAC